VWGIWPQERLGVEEKEISCTYRKVYKVNFIYSGEILDLPNIVTYNFKY
jgi:hypothetical protein